MIFFLKIRTHIPRSTCGARPGRSARRRARPARPGTPPVVELRSCVFVVGGCGCPWMREACVESMFVVDESPGGEAGPPTAGVREATHTRMETSVCMAFQAFWFFHIYKYLVARLVGGRERREAVHPKARPARHVEGHRLSFVYFVRGERNDDESTVPSLPSNPQNTHTHTRTLHRFVTAT